MHEESKYLEYYLKEPGKSILREESIYLKKKLSDCTKILDVGCGPGIFERELAELDIIGVDSSPGMIAIAKGITTNRFVVGSAEKLPFPDSSFDALFFVASLSSIDEPKKALEEAHRVLKARGKIVILALNPQSAHFRSLLSKGGFTQAKIRHRDMGPELLESWLSDYFEIEGEYMLGITGEKTFRSKDPKKASIYAMSGRKK